MKAKESRHRVHSTHNSFYVYIRIPLFHILHIFVYIYCLPAVAVAAAV